MTADIRPSRAQIAKRMILAMIVGPTLLILAIGALAWAAGRLGLIGS